MAQHHTVSGLVGKLVTELEVNCNADKYYEIFKNPEKIPTAVPHIYSSVKAIEGDGTTSGCIKQWDYTKEGKTLYVHEKTTYNDETKTIYHKVVGGDLTKDYKKFDVTLAIDAKTNGHGSIVSWTIEYEKLHEDSPVPIDYLIFFHSHIVDVNSYLCASE
ncbi:hypothetical protein MKW92_041465 [Papaver armeniacum]|nr:hypothetical protein MKW92_041465 [Papaver armeniacum]